MKLTKNILSVFTLFFFLISVASAQELYRLPKKNETRWFSFENQKGEKGVGAQENQGAKGHPSDQIKAGETVTLLQAEGAGIINRIWLTINDRSPEMLRSLRLEMYWDDSAKPAVSVPLGDFFGVGLGQRIAFENELFADPEGRSFNCFIPMPFKTAAKVTLTNDSDKHLNSLFYDINMIQFDAVDEDILYFHAWWNRQNPTILGEDYEILPELSGKGRFLGVNMGVKTDPVYKDSWWGEGEVKMYLDGDDEFPSLAGTGAEDYIGTAWGQGVFAHRYQGSLIADPEKGEFAFYRYHVPDPVYFHEDIKVTIQQIGGWPKEKVLELMAEGAPLIPVTIYAGEGQLLKLLEKSPVPDLKDSTLPKGWTNFYRQDDVSSTAYFYLNRPENNLPPLVEVELRIQ
jgi:hypothetical protein